MYALEIVFLLLMTAWLIVTSTTRATRGASVKLFAACAAAIVVAFAVGEARLHMIPAALVFVVLSVFLLRRGHSHVAIRAVGFVAGSTLLAVSATIALALPVVTLPAPDGPHAVGVTSFTLVDESRDESAFGAPGRPREIYVQAWYPGEMPHEGPMPRARTLWQELYRPQYFDVLFGYLGGMTTHSYEHIPFSTASGTYPTIVFSPSFSGIAEQNTLLMEHLASHGYIVLGITHPHFGMFTTYADGTGVPVSALVMDAPMSQGSVGLAEIAARADRADTSLERAGIRLEYFERGTRLTELMGIVVHDLAFLLDAVTHEDTASVPSVIARIDASRIGLLGMSYGGGAVTELCKTDARCRAAMNMDGGLWGGHIRQPLTVPYLALASPNNAPFFEHDLLTSEAPYYEITVQNARHSNFADVSVFVPLLRWLGVTGTINGGRVIDIMNTAATAFFDAHLRGAGAQMAELQGFPELDAKTNLQRLGSREPVVAGRPRF